MTKETSALLAVIFSNQFKSDPESIKWRASIKTLHPIKARIAGKRSYDMRRRAYVRMFIEGIIRLEGHGNEQKSN